MYLFILAYKIMVFPTINSILSLVKNSSYNDITTLSTDAFLTMVTTHSLTFINQDFEFAVLNSEHKCLKVLL